MSDYFDDYIRYPEPPMSQDASKPKPPEPAPDLWAVFFDNHGKLKLWNVSQIESSARDSAANNAMIREDNPRVERYVSESKIRTVLAYLYDQGKISPWHEDMIEDALLPPTDADPPR